MASNSLNNNKKEGATNDLSLVCFTMGAFANLCVTPPAAAAATVYSNPIKQK